MKLNKRKKKDRAAYKGYVLVELLENKSPLSYEEWKKLP